MIISIIPLKKNIHKIIVIFYFTNLFYLHRQEIYIYIFLKLNEKSNIKYRCDLLEVWKILKYILFFWFGRWERWTIFNQLIITLTIIAKT